MLIIALVFLGLEADKSGISQSPYFVLIVVGGVGVVVGAIISMGLVATLISIHDRHVELVEEIRLWRKSTSEFEVSQ
ncbi:hypothetical protein [Sphingomonas sp. PWP1-2]|uniref:hypothetical protein n=1 Tax=Sphingomonas sp. PWP1-2 TaxID=2804558 RepID=UPI003CF5850B